MKKVPFGFLTGLFAIFFFYLTIGVVALYIILNLVAQATGQSVSLFDNWYQTLLFVLDIFAFLGFATCLVFLVLRKKKGDEKHAEIVQ